MSTVSELTKRLGKLVADNSPAILTGIGVAGALTTAYLTGRASYKASRIISDQEWTAPGIPDEKLETKERIRLVWKLYIPAAGTAALTVAAIISANQIGNRRAAALAAAYSISEKAFDEYRQKVTERLGDKKEQAIRDELAKDRVSRNPIGNQLVVLTGHGQVLCYEEFTGRYFQSDFEALRKAQNDLNAQVINDSYASLTDLYSLLNLPQTANSDEVGWNLDKLLEFTYSYVGAEDGTPCLSLGFAVTPIRSYSRLS